MPIISPPPFTPPLLVYTPIESISMHYNLLFVFLAASYLFSVACATPIPKKHKPKTDPTEGYVKGDYYFTVNVTVDGMQSLELREDSRLGEMEVWLVEESARWYLHDKKFEPSGQLASARHDVKKKKKKKEKKVKHKQKKEDKKERKKEKKEGKKEKKKQKKEDKKEKKREKKEGKQNHDKLKRWTSPDTPATTWYDVVHTMEYVGPEPEKQGFAKLKFDFTTVLKDTEYWQVFGKAAEQVRNDKALAEKAANARVWRIEAKNRFDSKVSEAHSLLVEHGAEQDRINAGPVGTVEEEWAALERLNDMSQEYETLRQVIKSAKNQVKELDRTIAEADKELAVVRSKTTTLLGKATNHVSELSAKWQNGIKRVGNRIITAVKEGGAKVGRIIARIFAWLAKALSAIK